VEERGLRSRELGKGDEISPFLREEKKRRCEKIQQLEGGWKRQCQHMEVAPLIV
jgi:hypothetical protein